MSESRLTSSRPEVVQLGLDDPRWGRFLASRRDATPFHHPAWAGFLSEVYGYRAFGLLIGGDAGLPLIETRSPFRGRRWISLPFTDECPPLADDHAQLALGLDGERRRLGVRTVEVRGAVAGASATTAAVSHLLRLDPDPETVFGRFHRGQVQRGIRKAEKESLSIRRASNERDVTDVFYPLFVETRRRLGVPAQERRFFELLWQRVLEPGLGSVLIVFHNSQAVAGGVFLSSNGTSVYKYGASDAAAWKLRPNHLLFWTAIQEACLRGDTAFSFGRSDLGSEGLRAFKAGWGTDEHEVVHSTFGTTGARGTARRGSRAAEAVIRRSPLWVSRAAGKLLYKYAA